MQDNAPAYISQVARAAATKCRFEILPYYPYSPGLASSGFYLFPNLKSYFRGRNYGSHEDVIDDEPTLLVAMAVATKCSIEILLYHPYSPDLAPSDLYLVPNLKRNLRGRNSGSREEVIDDEYYGHQEEAIYFEEISKLEQRWRKCIKAKGDYIEK